MPTAKGGYYLKDGTRVPSVTTILGRFKEAGGLIHWAWQLGIDGKDYREERDKAADSGTLAHAAVESWIHGTPEHLIAFGESDVAQKAKTCFAAFLEWARQSQLKVTRTEVSLVSERYRFGGTLDAIMVCNRRSVGDWKSSNGIYLEYLAQIAAYGILWEENFPEEPIDGGYHLLRFDKEYGDFHHHYWNELAAGQRYFLHLVRAYEEQKELKKRAA